MSEIKEMWYVMSLDDDDEIEECKWEGTDLEKAKEVAENFAYRMYNIRIENQEGEDLSDIQKDQE